jgi:hypothetical protein
MNIYNISNREKVFEVTNVTNSKEENRRDLQ